MHYPLLRLRKGKEQSVHYRHPWIFSGAFENLKESGIASGSLVHVADCEGKIVATGTFSFHSMIAVRVFDFGKACIDRTWLREKITNAEAHRTQLGYGPGTETTGYRVCFGEADGLPGLVVDRYEDVLVVQISTAGAEGLKEMILDVLKEIFSPTAIVEKSNLPSRKDEKLEMREEILYGKLKDAVEFQEQGLKFFCDPLKGQKTGFFLDQKDLRREIQKWAKGRKVLNLFSYTGAAGVYAMKGGAKSVRHVDSSEWALEQCPLNHKLNKFAEKKISCEHADIFSWLTKPVHEGVFDMVILDPPAIIKSREDILHGEKAYHFLNRAAMRFVNDQGIFVTSSCSHFLTAQDFRLILQRAAVQNNMSLRILAEVGQSGDHPLSLSFPESRYLKSLVCLVERRLPS